MPRPRRLDAPILLWKILDPYGTVAPLQQDQRLREKRTCRMLSPKGIAYPYQRQVLLLARVAQVGNLRQTMCLCPVDGSHQVALP